MKPAIGKTTLIQTFVKQSISKNKIMQTIGTEVSAMSYEINCYTVAKI